MSQPETHPLSPVSQEAQLRYLVFGLNEEPDVIVACIKSHFARYPSQGTTTIPPAMRLPEPLESHLRSLLDRQEKPEDIVRFIEDYFAQKDRNP